MIGVLALVLASGLPAPGEGAELLDRMIRAHGGLERFRAIRDWHIVAERRLETGDVAREVYEEYLLREDGLEQTLLVKRREGETLVFGHDGERGFAVVDGEVRTGSGASGEGYYRAHGEYYLRAIPFKWKDPGVRVTRAGRDRVEGREVELLRITAAENVGRAWKDVWVAAVDAESGLLVEARLTHHRDMETWMEPREGGTASIVYRYGDYREVDGLRVAFKMEYHSGGRKTGENVVQEITLDGGVSRELFRPESHRAR